jgi:hypothetical protein
MRIRLLALSVLLAGALPACGGGGASGSSPTGPAAPVDLSGRWIDADGSTTLQLSHSGAAVTGTSSTAGANRVLGSYTAQGVLSGSVDGATFTFTDTATMSVAGCTQVVTGTLTISATTMSGPIKIVDTCQGAVAFTDNTSDRFTRR